MLGFPFKQISRQTYNVPLDSNTLRVFYSKGEVLLNGPTVRRGFKKVPLVPPSQNYVFASYESAPGASGGPVIEAESGMVVGIHIWSQKRIAAFVNIVPEPNQ